MNIKEFIRKKIANPLCELFPEKIKNKIHLVGTVLFGDDWNYYYVHPCPGFAQITHHDVEKIYSDLSESSLKVLLDYVDYQHGMKQLNRIVDLTKYTIIIPSAQSYPYVRDKVEQEKKACREAEKKSGFSNCTPEVFCYHHGLTLVPNEIKDYIKDSCFIDAGAYTGDSTYVFAQYQPSKILSFEPSTKNGKIFKRNMIKSKINCAQLIQAGISDTAGEFFIEEERGSGTKLGNSGKYKVKVVSIDNYLTDFPEKRIGVIKGDLEGMGLNMVKGAIKTIQKDRPVLLISIYHNSEEFLEVYKYLKANLNNYTYIVASLNTMLEITLIGYPKF